MKQRLVGEPKEIHFHWCGYFKSHDPWCHEEQTNPDYELMIGMTGEVYLEVDGEEVTLLPGMMLLIPPDTHFFGNRESVGNSFYWLHFACQGLSLSEDVTEISQDGRWVLPIQSQDLLLDSEILLMQQLQTIKQQPYTDRALVDSYTRTLLLSINEKFRYFNAPRSEIKRQHFLVDYLKNYLQKNYQHPLTVSSIANYFGYNKAYLSNLFSREVGQTMTQYLNLIRLEKARQQLLTSDDPINQIAREVGFDDEKYFSRLFARQYHLPPREYRRKIGKIQPM